MLWEHHTEPLATRQVFLRRMGTQVVLVVGIVAVALAIGTVGYIAISDLDFVDSFLEASMLMSGAGPLYTERSSPNSVKLFSSLYALFCTLLVVTMVGILAAPIIHRVFHRLHVERGGRRDEEP
jgi:MFS superfamily sulfate permease-like transporter